MRQERAAASALRPGRDRTALADEGIGAHVERTAREQLTADANGAQRSPGSEHEIEV